MARLISAATGNFSAAGTWAVSDATALLDSQAANTELTTAYVESAAFTPGAIIIDGIAIKLASRAASPTGTVSVRLAQAGVLVAGTEVTIDAIDLPTASAAGAEGGWILFKFAAPVTLAAATAYTVSAKESVATADIFLYRDATAGNWSRQLRTTTTQAPVAADTMDVMGEHTGAGTGNNLTVTMDITAATDFGAGTDAVVALTISKRGTLSYGTTAATNYYLKLSGDLIVNNGGTLNIGTVATPIPRDGSAVLEFDPVADGGMGLIARNGSTFIAQGLSRTVAKDIVSAKLNTDEAAAQTVLGVDTDTGWLSGDDIVIASTTRTAGQTEKRTLSVNASATELTVSAGLTNAHSGTSPTQAEVILLTRNVRIRSATSTLMMYCNFKPTSIIDIDWVEFYYLGSGVFPKEGIEVENTTLANFNINRCSLHDFEVAGLFFNATGGAGGTITNNVFYNMNTSSLTYNAIDAAGTNATYLSGTVITGNIIMLVTGTVNGEGAGIVIFSGDTATIQDNTVVSAFNGFELEDTGSAVYADFSGNIFSGNVSHSNGADGLNDRSGVLDFTISNFTSWRNTQEGMDFLDVLNISLNTITLFGNTTDNLEFDNLIASSIISLTSNGDTTFSTANGINILGNICVQTDLISCDFSTVSGIKTAHTTDISTSGGLFEQLSLNNCKLGGTNEFDFNPKGNKKSYFSSQKHDQTAGNHKTLKLWGNITIDTTAGLFRTASPSERLTPNDASNKLESGSKKIAVANGATLTPSVYARESVVGDGTDYNGARPRLILKRNDAIGITADTVIDTNTVAGEGAFELLSGTTAAATDDGVMEFVVDVDGSTGWVNIDDWSVV